MNKKNIKLNKKTILKKTLWGLFFVFILFLLTIIISYIFPNERVISDNLRVPMQRWVMLGISNSTIENRKIAQAIGENYIIKDGKNNISFKDLEDYFPKLRTGDIIFTKSGKYLSSVFIPGKWKHSAIYIGSKNQLLQVFNKNSAVFKYLEKYYTRDDQRLIIDSNADGVTVRDIKELSNLSESSYLKSLSVFRINKNKGLVISFIQNIKKHLGKEYDFDFITKDKEKMYCSELIYHSLKGIGFEIKTKEFMARRVISPDNLANYMVNSESFSLVSFLKKENGLIQELNKYDLRKEISIY